jgi:hypothetical protein
MPQEPTVEEVLEELDAIARGLHPSQKTILEEYRKCPDWQLAAQLVAKGIQRLHRGTGQYRLLDVPPGWLPPSL